MNVMSRPISKARNPKPARRGVRQEPPNTAAILAGKLPAELVGPVVEHHRAIATARLSGDHEKVLLRGGKLAEAVMRLMRFERTGEITKAVNVEEEIRLAESTGSLPSEMRTLIPRHARILYDHRNKRGGGHDSFEPIEMDAVVVSSVSNWLIGELLRVFGGQSHERAHAIAQAVIRTISPFIEEIGEDVVVLLPGAAVSAEIAVLLLRSYPTAVARESLQSALADRSSAALRMALLRLNREKRVHEADDGLVLTRLGLVWAEGVVRDLASASLP